MAQERFAGPALNERSQNMVGAQPDAELQPMHVIPLRPVGHSHPFDAPIPCRSQRLGCVSVEWPIVPGAVSMVGGAFGSHRLPVQHIKRLRTPKRYIARVAGTRKAAWACLVARHTGVPVGAPTAARSPDAAEAITVVRACTVA
eukprot:scaffold168712_cov31-Tisochrysis_lutea.AAC.5